jgi:hypothetical protein
MPNLPVKSLPPALQAHLEDGTATLSWCWRMTRSDGVVFGFTDHDRALEFNGTVFDLMHHDTSGHSQMMLSVMISGGHQAKEAKRPYLCFIRHGGHRPDQRFTIL